jgi:hypothetical protein
MPIAIARARVGIAWRAAGSGSWPISCARIPAGQENGLTGLTEEQVRGTTDTSAYTLWSGRCHRVDCIPDIC